jgi:hypothetical protein
MKQTISSFLLLVGILLTLAVLCLSATPVVEAASTSRSWNVVSTPNVPAVSDTLNGISAISANNAWAVGSSWNSETGASQTLIEQWNGASWSIISSPSPNEGQLNAVLALSARNVWAVGSQIVHWNGMRWAVMPNPDAGASLYAIAASSGKDIWAVGADAVGTVTEHWNGVMWSLVPSPSPAGSLDTLWGVTVVSPANAWAVGDYFTSLEPPHNVTLMLHWNGKQWARVKSPSPTGGINILHSVAAVSASDIWAIGNMSRKTDPTVDRTMIQHWSGTKWSLANSPNQSSFTNALLSVAVSSVNDVWAVGDYDPGTLRYQTLTEHWNGTNWTTVSSPNVGTDQNILRDVAPVPGTRNAWAVGDYFDITSNTWQTLAEYYG